MRSIGRWITLSTGWVVAVGTLLSVSRNPHWLVRMWDFPRVQMTLLSALSGVAHAALFSRGRSSDRAFLATTTLCVLWQLRNIYPYTPLAPKQVERAQVTPRGRSIRLLISNVMKENFAHERLLETIERTDPDLVLAVEIDANWARALAPLQASYPYVVRQPQDDYYGLMLFSRFPLIDPEVHFLVQDDVPSVRTGVELPSGDRVVLHGLHPRPPEPVRDQDSTPRDAELVLVGQGIGENGDAATIVAGDLNDVAWSPTTRLFLRLSGLLDPRIGRGTYSSYHARNPLLRYPLDHIFHSRDFRLVTLRRLPSIGSDHFPILVELSYQPSAREEQRGLEERPEDLREAEDKLQQEAEAARTGEDRPGRE